MHLGKSYMLDALNPLFSVPVPQNSDAKQEKGEKRTSKQRRDTSPDSGKCAAAC